MYQNEIWWINWKYGNWKIYKYEGFNINKDIFNFISTIKDKYKAKISYDLLNNFEEDERSKIKDIILINYKRYF